jgi:hypothetical protein
MNVQNEMTKQIYTNLKSDLKLCNKFMRKQQPEKVKEYFWTLERDKINEQLQVICKPFSLIQKIQIERLISELHTFISNYNESWLKKSKKSLS